MQTQLKVGRNDPCSCGSGKKYKRCCLRNGEAVDLTWHRLRRAEGQLVEGALGHVRDRYGRAVLDAAWAEFALWPDPPEDPVERPEFECAFLPWFVFNWVAGSDAGDDDVPADWPHRPLALEYVDLHPETDAFIRRFVDEACQRPFSFWTVTGVQRGRSLALKNLMTAAECEVLERSGSQQLERGAIVFGRVLALDGVAIMCGSAPLVIPPRFHGELMSLRQAIAGRDGWLVEDELHDCDLELREKYFAIADELYNPRPLQLCNTDGDPLAFVKIRFELRCAPRETFERLAALSLGEAQQALSEATYGASGALQAVSFSWLKRGNKVHADWNNTIMGSLSIDGAQLTAEVNSEKRAQTIRSKIEKLLGDRVVFRGAEIKSVEQAVKEKRGRPETAAEHRAREENERLQALPEVQAQLRALGERHWEQWLDQKIPALCNQTPRQAAQTVSGRELLEALLTDFEWTTGGQPDMPMNPDVAALRRRLGLSGGEVLGEMKCTARSKR